MLSNEELVKEIRSGNSVAENMKCLYERNLTLIKRYIQKYTLYEDIEDLLQEAYFGLWEAIKHYETAENVLFMSYASFWIKQAVQRYIEKCGSVIRIPSYTRQMAYRFKKTVRVLEQELNREPCNREIADRMCVPVDLVPELNKMLQSVASLDTPLVDNDEQCLSDVIQTDYILENDVVDNVYNEYLKNELWTIVARYTNDIENEIIKECFAKNKPVKRVAEEYGTSYQCIRTIKDKGIHKLRFGRAKKELFEKLEIAERCMYRGGKTNYDMHNMTSTVEYIAVRRYELEGLYHG